MASDLRHLSTRMTNMSARLDQLANDGIGYPRLVWECPRCLSVRHETHNGKGPSIPCSVCGYRYWVVVSGDWVAEVPE